MKTFAKWLALLSILTAYVCIFSDPTKAVAFAVIALWWQREGR